MDNTSPMMTRPMHKKWRAGIIWSGVLSLGGIILCVLGLTGVFSDAGKRPYILWLSVAVGVLIFGYVIFISIRDYFFAQRIKVFCNHCGKYIDKTSAWICGFCDTENSRTKWFSFLHKCARCGKSPHALQCSHCMKQIYLDETHKVENTARIAGVMPPTGESPAETHTRSVTELKRKQELTRLNAELEKEEAALEAIRKAKEKSVEKPVGEQLERSFSKYRDRNLAVAMIAKRELARAEKEYADDPDMFERSRLMVEAWREDNLQ